MSFKRRRSFTKEDPWRIFRIMSEFVDGFEELSNVVNAVSIFGSARTKPHSRYYKLAENIAYLLADNGLTVITGAGPGIMEAANKGAKAAGGVSIGLNILIPSKQKPNKFVTKLIEFKYFFCRKVMFAKYSKAFVVLPGGFGTMDEFFEGLSLIQTGRIEPFPVILVGKEYWRGLLQWIKKAPLRTGALLKSELAIFTTIEKPSEILKYITDFYNK